MTEYPSNRVLEEFGISREGYDTLEVQWKALFWYSDAKWLGQPKREQAIKVLHKGIACFDSLADAVQDAEENIKRYTCSNFAQAHFYELVRCEALKQVYGDSYSKCKTCGWFPDGKCKNKASHNEAIQIMFWNATPEFGCKCYYAATPKNEKAYQE